GSSHEPRGSGAGVPPAIGRLAPVLVAGETPAQTAGTAAPLPTDLEIGPGPRSARQSGPDHRRCSPRFPFIDHDVVAPSPTPKPHQHLFGFDVLAHLDCFL